jgi:hypothetical protein
MDYRALTAPCGLDCWNCGVYKAASDPALRASIAERLGVAEEKVACRGCRAEGGTIPLLNMTQPCKVWRCVSAQGLAMCSDCADFPCDHLHPRADLAQTRPHNLKVFNLATIRRVGLEEWARTKAAEARRGYFQVKLEL